MRTSELRFRSCICRSKILHLGGPTASHRYSSPYFDVATGSPWCAPASILQHGSSIDISDADGGRHQAQGENMRLHRELLVVLRTLLTFSKAHRITCAGFVGNLQRLASSCSPQSYGGEYVARDTFQVSLHIISQSPLKFEDKLKSWQSLRHIRRLQSEDATCPPPHGLQSAQGRDGGARWHSRATTTHPD